MSSSIDITTTPATPTVPGQHDEPPAVAVATAANQPGSKTSLTTAALSSLPAPKASASGLAIPLRPQSPDTLSLVSADDFSELRLGRIGSRQEREAAAAAEAREHAGHVGETGVKGWCRRSWKRNKGLVLVLLSQIFGTLMNVTARLLETDSEDAPGMHPFQILFARMGITFLICLLYMWWTNVEGWPWGAKDVRMLLVARSIGGFFGVIGMYYSLQHLALSDATVLTFLAPTISCFLCSKLINQPFTHIEKICAFVSLFGVVLIARPTAIFAHSDTDTSPDTDVSASPSPHLLHPRAPPSSIPPATPHERLASVGMAMLGVLGAAVAYTTIRWVGQRAHPLVLVNFFACFCTVIAFAALVAFPGVPFALPASLRQWTLLVYIGVSGFLLQYLLTAGLRLEKSSRATNMIFSQMVFALAFDKLIWGTQPGLLSIVGSGLILGAAVVAAVQKEADKGTGVAEAERSGGEEEAGLMAGTGNHEEGEAVELRDTEEGRRGE